MISCYWKLNSQIYREVEDTRKQRVVYHSAIGNGPLNGMPVTAPYPPLDALDKKRLLARKSNSTTYCYDFPLVNIWIEVEFCWLLQSESISTS